jgi:hypothetical protein
LDVARRGLLFDIETLWLDRGYDSDITRHRLANRLIDDAVIAKNRKRGSTGGGEEPADGSAVARRAD